jgi:hypothetical protein
MGGVRVYGINACQKYVSLFQQTGMIDNDLSQLVDFFLPILADAANIWANSTQKGLLSQRTSLANGSIALWYATVTYS